jgi:predicted AAA+ superfamily ATPase
MAMSNRDRIGQMLEVLAPALDEFIASAVAPDIDSSATWVDLVQARDLKKGIQGRDYHRGDPQLQFRMLTENVAHHVRPGWYPFDGKLSRVQQSYASELRDVRDDWAHNKSFGDDDAYRALDTAERLLSGIGAAPAAEQVAAIRLNLRRVTADKDDRKTLKKVAGDNPESLGLKPWREVLQPHDDVATGNFQASEFAADLYKVATGSPDQSKDYADPVEFFSRTYLTEGLRDLIDRAVRRLSGDNNASPVINLQTNFGGGKTHSMLSLWHTAAGLPVGEFSQDVQDLLVDSGYDGVPAGVRRVAIVGNHFATSGETKSDGTVVNTIWGDLAWQLGGAEGYALVAEADRTSTPPGKALHTLLEKYAPAVILIDEWVAYARTLVGRGDLAGGTFDDQFTFAQSLTEAVKGTTGVMLAISIPASESGDDSTSVAGNAEEVGGRNGQEALARLQNVVRRVADQWRPASSDEAYHIVRQRLFVTPDADALASMGNTARKFVEMYRKYSDDFPREARDAAYEDRIKRTYPIHPELFDRLYEDWSSLERFQRTRGVLRLMNTVIHALWVGEDQSPLIMPGSIPLASANVNSELTQYLQDSWKAVIDADVDGVHSEPAKIDTERPLFGQRALTKRLARTVFFGAAPTIGAAHKGIETQRVFLGTAVPGDVPGNFHAALTQLGDRATYFYSGQGKYWYDLQANITRRAKDQADRLHKEDVWAEIVRRLADQSRVRGDFAGVHVCPEENSDIPDTDETRLVILHPKVSHKKSTKSGAIEFAHKATENRGTGHRTYRNMVVFLAADEDRMSELETAVRDYLAWSSVMSQAAELDLTGNQKTQAEEKRRQADQTVLARLLGAYQWALVPEQPDAGSAFIIGAHKAEGQSTSLAERVSRRLGNDGALNTQQAASAVRQTVSRIPKVWESGYVSIGELWNLYASYVYMPRLRDQQVLNKGVANQPMLWDSEGFALADSYNAEAGRYVGLIAGSGELAVQVKDSTLIVRPDVASAQLELDRAQSSRPEAESNSETEVDPRSQFVEVEPGVHQRVHRKKRFFGTKELNPGLYTVDFKKLADEVLAHLRSDGVTLTVRVEIEATSPLGFDEAKVRTVSENANTLKFEQSGFEDS